MPLSCPAADEDMPRGPEEEKKSRMEGWRDGVGVVVKGGGRHVSLPCFLTRRPFIRCFLYSTLLLLLALCFLNPLCISPSLALSISFFFLPWPDSLAFNLGECPRHLSYLTAQVRHATRESDTTEGKRSEQKRANLTPGPEQADFLRSSSRTKAYTKTFSAICVSLKWAAICSSLTALRERALFRHQTFPGLSRICKS